MSVRAIWIVGGIAIWLITSTIMVIGHWQIAVASYGYVGPDGIEQQRTEIYRLDRWNGHVQYCTTAAVDTGNAPPDDKALAVQCPAPNALP